MSLRERLLWNHNTFYHPLLLRRVRPALLHPSGDRQLRPRKRDSFDTNEGRSGDHEGRVPPADRTPTEVPVWAAGTAPTGAPAPARRVLDVGCGRGVFAAELARWADQVDALDRSPEMIADARRRVPSNVRLLAADLLTAPLPAGHYDAITSVTALHHMPLEPALRRLADALKPGGVLVAIALPRLDLPRQLPVELTAALAQRVFAVGIGVLRLLPRYRTLLARDPEDAEMPVVLDPELSVRDARRIAETVLPGARVRRLLFWRYLLVWHKPIS